MANIQIVCPHCETQFKYRLPQAHKMKTLRIRPGPGGGRFEYTATVDSNILESGQFTRLDDLMLFPTGAAVGVAIGLLVYAMVDSALGFHSVEPLVYFAGIGGSAGLLLTQWWLCDEAAVRRRAWRWWQEMSSKWLLVNEDEHKHKPVVLEVDHRYRDGHTEAGRTVQYFGTLPCEPDVFNDYVKSVMAGETLAIAQWTGAGKPFSRQEYERVLDILKQGGLVLTYPGKGNKLTRKGYRTLESYLGQIGHNTPSPAI